MTMRKLFAFLIAALFALEAFAQGVSFPGPGDRTRAGGGGFANTKSLIDNYNDLAHLYSRTQGTGSSRQKMTFNCWFYTGSSGNAAFYVTANNNNAADIIVLASDAAGSTYVVVNGGADGFVIAAAGATFATSTWYQFTVQIDTTQATASNRVKIYINQSLDSSNHAVAVTSNYSTNWGLNGDTENIALAAGATTDGLIDEISKIDNATTAASSFATAGAPKDISGLTFGNQGYWIRFETGAAATGGNDSSSNGLNFTNSGYVNGDFSSTVP